MNKCPKCGNKLSPVDVLCPRCGALVEVIHVAPHPDAVQTEKRDEAVAYHWEPDMPAEHHDMPITEQAREAALPEQDDLQISRQSLSEAFEEDDMPMSRQAHKAAMRAHRNKKPALSAVPQESTNPEVSEAKKWLELEEVDPERIPSQNISSVQDNSDYDAVFKDNSLFDDDNDISGSYVAEEVYGSVIDDSPHRSRMRSADEAENEPRKEKSRKRSPSALIVLMWVVIAAAVFGLFYFLDTYVASTYGGWDDFVRQLTNGKIELDTGASYQSSIDVNISEVQTENGAPAHRFDITMAGGKSIKVMPLNDTFDMNNGFVSFIVTDEDLARSLGTVSSDPTVTSGDIKLEVATTSQTFTHAVPSITLSLTEAAYAIEAPSLTNLISTEKSLQIAITVSPDATVFINNNNFSAKIDDYGHLSVSMPLDMGENLFVIEVIQPGRRTVKKSFTVICEETQASLVPSHEYLRVDESSFECTGSTDPDATLTASLNGKLLKALIAENGKYSIACTLENHGIYSLLIKAAYEGRSNAEATVVVEYVPEQKTFFKDAKAYTVSKMIKNISSLNDTAVKIEGKADSIIAKENSQTFVIVSGEDKLNCYYYGSTQLSPDKAYAFYGIADAKNNSFYVIFVA